MGNGKYKKNPAETLSLQFSDRSNKIIFLEFLSLSINIIFEKRLPTTSMSSTGTTFGSTCPRKRPIASCRLPSAKLFDQ